MKLKPMLAAQAKKRQGKRNDLNIPQNSAECSKNGETREDIAKIAGVSNNYIPLGGYRGYIYYIIIYIYINSLICLGLLNQRSICLICLPPFLPAYDGIT